MLAKYLTSPEVERHEASAGGHTPVGKSIFEKVKASQTGRDAKRMAAFEETINHCAMIPSSSRGTCSSKILGGTVCRGR